MVMKFQLVNCGLCFVMFIPFLIRGISKDFPRGMKMNRVEICKREGPRRPKKTNRPNYSPSPPEAKLRKLLSQIFRLFKTKEDNPNAIDQLKHFHCGQSQIILRNSEAKHRGKASFWKKRKTSFKEHRELLRNETEEYFDWTLHALIEEFGA